MNLPGVRMRRSTVLADARERRAVHVGAVESVPGTHGSTTSPGPLAWVMVVGILGVFVVTIALQASGRLPVSSYSHHSPYPYYY